MKLWLNFFREVNGSSTAILSKKFLYQKNDEIDSSTAILSKMFLYQKNDEMDDWRFVLFLFFFLVFVVCWQMEFKLDLLYFINKDGFLIFLDRIRKRGERETSKGSRDPSSNSEMFELIFLYGAKCWFHFFACWFFLFFIRHSLKPGNVP